MTKTIIPEGIVTPDEADSLVFFWYGIGKGYIYRNGAYQRDETNDYVFSVRQKRHGNTWKSIKNMHRTHPDYKATKASPRNQTMYFQIDYRKQADKIKGVVTSSLGKGVIVTDQEFRKQELEIAVDTAQGIAGLFMPFNTFSITQDYNYENGILTETVLLQKKKKDATTPYFKSEETAHMFIKSSFTKAPTTFR